MKYLLLDGNNLSLRSAFSNQELKNSQGIPTGVHYGFFRSLIYFKEKYPDSQFLISWDSKSKRRMEESEAGVKSGIIPLAYKENRKKDEQPKPLIDFYEQAPYLKRAIGKTGIPQIHISGYETDDILGSYCNILKKDNEVIVVTSDKDYFQLLDKNVKMYDGMKNEFFTLESFKEEYKIDPIQHIDCGAFSGDDSDGIYGVPGWGEVKSLEAIQEFGNYKKAIESFKNQLEEHRKNFKDLVGEDFEKLSSIKTKSGKPKFPEITPEMPFSGVALAVEKKQIKPIPKTVLMVLMFEKRIDLAYSLKKIDTDIENLPEIKNSEKNLDKLLEYFKFYEMPSLNEKINVFSS